MVQKIQDIQVINIDDVPYAVDTMSDTSKRLVAVYNDWNNKEAGVRDELMMVQAAKETLSRQIIDQVRNEQAEAAAKEKADAEAQPEVEVNTETQPEVPSTPAAE